MVKPISPDEWRKRLLHAAWTGDDCDLVEHVCCLERAVPRRRLPANTLILVPNAYSLDRKEFVYFGPAKLSEVEALNLAFWMTAMDVAALTAPELLPYVNQLQPIVRSRLGRVVRAGTARLD